MAQQKKKGNEQMNYFIECFTKKFCCLDGRARRQEYWMFTLFSILVFLAITAIAAIIPMPAVRILGLVLYVVWCLAIILPGLGVTVRRLHDTGKSGWWILINLVPFGNLILLVFMIMDSTPGDNMFGPNPKGV